MQAGITDYQTVKKLGARYLNVCQLANFANANSVPRQAIFRCPLHEGRPAVPAFILTLKL